MKKNNLNTPTSKEIQFHYELEKSLAQRLLQATKEERLKLYGSLYDELFQKVPYLNTAAADPEKRQRAVKGQLNFLKQYLQSDVIFMEIGTGDCALSEKVAQYVKQVFAVDVSMEITRGNNWPVNFQFLLSDGVSVPVPTNTVNVVFSNQLIEHLHPEDALEQLRIVYEKLAPNGTYLCITPNRLGGPFDISRSFDEIATGFHLKEYTHSELKKLFNKAGFKKILARIGGRGFYFNLPILPIVILENCLEKLPNQLRRKIASTPPFVWLLGIKIIAFKR